VPDLVEVGGVAAEHDRDNGLGVAVVADRGEHRRGEVGHERLAHDGVVVLVVVPRDGHVEALREEQEPVRGDPGAGGGAIPRRVDLPRGAGDRGREGVEGDPAVRRDGDLRGRADVEPFLGVDVHPCLAGDAEVLVEACGEPVRLVVEGQPLEVDDRVGGELHR
jgi:hypothetical protein